MAYLYRHIRLDKNEPFYIGIGSDDKGYYKRAKSTYGRNLYWRNVAKITKYKVEILLDDLTWEDACKKESEFISLYGRRDLKEGTLTNKTSGGDGTLGFVYTEEERKKRSDIQKNLYANGYINPNKGRKFSDNLNYINPNKGKKSSIEKIEKMKENHQSKKEGYINPCLGIKKTPEQIEKLRDFRLKHYENPENRKKISDGLKKAYDNGYINAFSKSVINIQNGFIYNSSKEAWIASGLNCHKGHFRSMLNGKKTNKTNYVYLEDYNK
jgi:hypothetical protein